MNLPRQEHDARDLALLASLSHLLNLSFAYPDSTCPGLQQLSGLLQSVFGSDQGCMQLISGRMWKTSFQCTTQVMKWLL